jgi:hypothetical protein
MMRAETVEGGACVGPRFTEILAGFRAELPDGRVTLSDCAAILGDRAFGGFLLLLSLPNILPLPWGFATALCIPMVLIATQMLLGRRRLWLPGILLRLGAEREVVARALDRSLPMLRRTERWLKPRLAFLSSSPAERLVGAVCLFLCVVLVLPVPFLGWFPAFALVALALGLVERDGIMLLVGYALSVLTLLALLVTLAGILAAGHALI